MRPLLDSIAEQNFADIEIVVCEDKSPERELIRREISSFERFSSITILYIENSENLGYDANIRKLVEVSSGRFCFFMGNDDIMAVGALKTVHDILCSHADAGFVLKSYAWFDNVPERTNQEVRYFQDVRYFEPSVDSVALCFRRSGVISGFIVDRDLAFQASTDRFDGYLYYQMHLVAYVLERAGAVTCPSVLVLCRNSEPPDFGASRAEAGVFTPGAYTVAARLKMLAGISAILDHSESRGLVGIKQKVLRDYANYFFPYIRDQLDAPMRQYWMLYAGYCKLGYWRFAMFHFYMIICRVLGADNFDAITRFVRKKLGRTVQFGSIFK